MNSIINSNEQQNKKHNKLNHSISGQTENEKIMNKQRIKK